MSWTINKDSLFGQKANEIGYFLPSANEKERTMIKNGSDLLDLVGEFVMDYDEGKTPLKNVCDRIAKIVDTQTIYKIVWTKTHEGELLNEKGQVIFFFVKPDSGLANIIKYLPEVYSCSQDLLNNLASTSKHEIKKIYNRICDFHDKTDEN